MPVQKVTVSMVLVLCLLILPVKPKVEEGSALTVVEADDSDVQISIDDEDEISNAKVFEPTMEWQTVEKGQSIPRGLHVRMNLATHQREAKLVEDNEDAGTKSSAEERLVDMKEKLKKDSQKDGKQDTGENLKYWKEGDRAGMANLNKDTFTVDELKKALKNFKVNADDVQDDKVLAEAVKKKFRPLEDLRKDFDKLNLNVKTELEILTELMAEYKDPNLSEQRHLHILMELEYYVHQIDIGMNFAQMGGLDLLMKDLNHTKEEIRQDAAFVLGSASQSNPTVQIQAIESGAMQQLIRMLSIESSREVGTRVLYALSCMMRHFPFAQQKFLASGGMQTLTQLFNMPNTEKLRLKAVTLVSDLLHEREAAALHVDIKKTHEFEKLQQYKSVALREAVVEHGWCGLVPTLLNLEEHDGREKIFVAMSITMRSCRTSFRSFRPTLTSLKEEYATLASRELDEGEVDGYFTKLLTSLDEIIRKIDLKEEL